VDLVYGYLGAIMPVYDELYKFKDKLHHVLVHVTNKVQHMLLKDLQEHWKVGVAILLQDQEQRT
jgi:acetolactate synthase-1/2/3 large subunit